MSIARNADDTTTTTIPMTLIQISPLRSSAVMWESKSALTESRKLTNSLRIVYPMEFHMAHRICVLSRRRQEEDSCRPILNLLKPTPRCCQNS